MKVDSFETLSAQRKVIAKLDRNFEHSEVGAAVKKTNYTAYFETQEV